MCHPPVVRYASPTPRRTIAHPSRAGHPPVGSPRRATSDCPQWTAVRAGSSKCTPRRRLVNRNVLLSAVLTVTLGAALSTAACGDDSSAGGDKSGSAPLIGVV